jgi:hypothetical protein
MNNTKWNLKALFAVILHQKDSSEEFDNLGL